MGTFIVNNVYDQYDIACRQQPSWVYGRSIDSSALNS